MVCYEIIYCLERVSEHTIKSGKTQWRSAIFMPNLDCKKDFLIVPQVQCLFLEDVKLMYLKAKRKQDFLRLSILH